MTQVKTIKYLDNFFENFIKKIESETNAKRREEIREFELKEIAEANYRRFIAAKPNEDAKDCTLINFQWKDSEAAKEMYFTAYNFCERIVEKRLYSSLLLHGSPGTGKTHLATGIIRYMVAREKPCPYEGISDYFSAYYMRSDSVVSDAYASKNIEKYYDYYSDYDLLVIDEVGRSLRKNMEREAIFALVDRIKAKNHAVILISNLDFEGLSELLGDACISRLTQKESGFVVNTEGEKDRRISDAKSQG